MIFQPWQLLLLAVSGWINRHQQDVIAYLKEENRILKRKLKGKRIRFTDDERRRLAVKAKALGRKVLSEVGSIVTPDTLMAWHRKVIAKKWNYVSKRGPGRPRVMVDIVALVLRIAEGNPTWGYTRIRGALANLGHVVGRGTIANILKEHGIEPAPARGKGMSWITFLRAYWDSISASDLFTAEVWTRVGLVRYYVLFFIRLSTRQVHIAGVTQYPHGQWMQQVARNITNSDDGFLLGTRYLILDRDGIFTSEYRRFLEREGIQLVRLPARSPNLNAYAERFVRSIREECLDRMIVFGVDSLRHAITEFVDHYHRERNHQGLENRLIDPDDGVGGGDGAVDCRERLGGMLRYYYRRAA